MDMVVTFSGKAAVHAWFKGFHVSTDQPAPDGEDGAPTPFDLFLASLGTCMGFYALRFCSARGIDPQGLALRLGFARDDASHRLAAVSVEVRPPDALPAKYLSALRAAVESCAVKRVLDDPPRFDVAIAPQAVAAHP
jgi:ribosomal protein S12 methylthiotransferase accessory factor